MGMNVPLHKPKVDAETERELMREVEFGWMGHWIG